MRYRLGVLQILPSDEFLLTLQTPETGVTNHDRSVVSEVAQRWSKSAESVEAVITL